MTTDEKNLITRLPEDVHLRFRLATVRQGTSMNQVVNDLILKWLEENEEAGAHGH